MIKRVIVFLLALFLGNVSAGAVSVIRDTETEELLLGYIRPIFTAAGLNPENAEVVIINDPSINAFVAGGQTIFVHTGLLLKAHAPDEVVFVLSHETGHIVGGHIVRGYQALQNAQTTALISTVLGGVLAVAGGRPDAGIAVMMGGQTSAMGLFTKYRQTEESSADRIAVDIIQKLGYSMAGFEGVMKTIKADERLNSGDGDLYLRTHPMTQTRVDELKRFLKNPPPFRSEPAFDLVKAKLHGFLDSPDKVLQIYKSDALADRYARAIAFYRKNNFKQAFELIEDLVLERPDNPYFYELKGQLLFETGQLETAKEAYRQAYLLKSDSTLIQLSYAHVLLELGGPKNAHIAEERLQYIVGKEPDDSFGWQLLAKAYDRQGKKWEAEYAMAEYERSIGKIESAQQRARKIIDVFSDNPIMSQKIQDIIDMEPQK
ncbi:MAG: M48 family metalloprotease [Alphaproteobacteria bacterium]|nr:M48 family metalloprotease [Alphaproteobacteria bacterium]